MMKKKALDAGVLLLALTTSRIVGAAWEEQDYTGWRGQSGDGSASSFIEPQSWPTSLTRKWKTRVGEGYATPLVVGDTVYAFSRQDGSEVVTALDAATGAERWHTSYPAPYDPSEPAKAHGASPKATPLYRDGTLFTLGVSGILSAFDVASHVLLWQIPASGEPPFFGAAVSPASSGGLLFVHPGSYGPLTAFDMQTGQRKWSVGSAGFFASPILVRLAGTEQVVSATTDSIIGVSLDGRLLWRHPWPGGGGSTTPVLSGDTLIVSGPDQGVVAIRPNLRNDAWTTETVWETKEVSMYVSSPVLVDGALYGLSTRARGQFFAIDVRTGKVLWLGEPREAENTAVVKAGTLLFLLNDDAELIVARANRERFEPLARYTVADSATWAQPAISGKRIFIKDATDVSLWFVD